MKRTWIALALAIPLAGTLALGQSKDKKDAIAPFMRQKLKFSQSILEGLAVENYSTISVNSKALNLLSQAAEWQALPDIEYVRYSTEFQRLTNELSRLSNEKNLDGATLAYVQLTINCVNCHKVVRDARKKVSRE